MDQDLASRQEARELGKQAEEAQKVLRTFSQEKLDAIVPVSYTHLDVYKRQGEKRPAPGPLIYRGYDICDLIRGVEKDGR